jgi:hypothetical protein
MLMLSSFVGTMHATCPDHFTLNLIAKKVLGRGGGRLTNYEVSPFAAFFSIQSSPCLLSNTKRTCLSQHPVLKYPISVFIAARDQGEDVLSVEPCNIAFLKDFLQRVCRLYSAGR